MLQAQTAGNSQSNACVHRKILNTIKSPTSRVYPIVLKPPKYNRVFRLVYVENSRSYIRAGSTLGLAAVKSIFHIAHNLCGSFQSPQRMYDAKLTYYVLKAAVALSSVLCLSATKVWLQLSLAQRDCSPNMQDGKQPETTCGAFMRPVFAKICFIKRMGLWSYVVTIYILCRVQLLTWKLCAVCKKLLNL